jgi:hypothetical protein
MVDAINSTLNLKDVYERSKILITETKGLKDDYSFYFTYFMKAWEAHKTEIEELWRQEFISVKDAQLALRNVLDRELPEITREGVARMLDGPEIKLHAMPDELKTVYKQLVD